MVGLRQGEKKRGGEIKILKRGSKLSQGMGVLKRGGGWNPLTNYGVNWSRMRSLNVALVHVKKQTQQVSVTDIYLDGQSLEIKEKLCILVIQYGLRRGAIDSLITRI